MSRPGFWGVYKAIKGQQEVGLLSIQTPIQLLELASPTAETQLSVNRLQKPRTSTLSRKP